jgi:P27 family predicted phage terminase small subunit
LTVTAAALKLADELGVDLEQVEGSGKNGRIIIGDVRAADIADAAGMPSEFVGRERRIWEDVEHYLRTKGLWNKVYSELLERYIRALTRAREARETEEQEGTTAEGSTGQTVVHPVVKIARDAEHDALDLAKELLITPAAQLRHEKEAEPADDDVPGADASEALGF